MREAFMLSAKVLEIEAVAENHLSDQMICGVRHADAQTKIHFPFRGKVQVDGGKELMLLLAYRQEIRCRTNGAVILKAAGDFFCEVVAELEVRRKHHPLRHAGAVE